MPAYVGRKMVPCFPKVVHCFPKHSRTFLGSCESRRLDMSVQWVLERLLLPPAWVLGFVVEGCR